MSLKTEELPGSPEAGLALGQQPSSYQAAQAAASALSAGDAQSLWLVVSLRTGCLIRKRKERERGEPVPKTQKAVTQEALCKAAGAVQQGLHTAEGPRAQEGL